MKSKAIRNLLLITILSGIVSGISAGCFFALTSDLPQIQSLENFKPFATTRIYSSQGDLIGELYTQKRTPVSLSEIPKNLITALITTEDRRFYEHSGLAIKGILRAILQNIRTGRYAQGASTLTQQLAKTLFLTPRKTFHRKLKEAVLAFQLERRYTKKEILELYLNQIYLGSGAYGVSAAARIYFDKSPNDLTLAECALIAGLPKAPSRYSPLSNPEVSKKRRDIVLLQMYKTGSIDKDSYQKAVQEPVTTVASTDPERKAPYFLDFVKTDLEKLVGDALMYKGGLTVHTTISQHIQNESEQALSYGLEHLDRRMSRNKIPTPHPQGAVIAIDIASGQILGMVGGRNYGENSFNRAVDALRQPGSAMKPFVFAQAIERGFDQTQRLLDAPVAFHTAPDEKDWMPENFSKSYNGEVSLRWALVHSKNIPAVRLIEKLGPSSVVQFCRTMGITSPLEPNLTLALGSSEVSLLELTAGYAVFANHGKYIRPYAITEIIDSDGKVIHRTRPQQHIAMSRAGSAIVTDMLSGVIKQGTGRSASILTGPVAGKTGTTNECKDALFIGYSPDLAVGVWVGNDDASTLGPRETGARAALPIWIDIMQAASQQDVVRYFDIPDGVVMKTVDPKSGVEESLQSPNAIQVLVKTANKS